MRKKECPRHLECHRIPDQMSVSLHLKETRRLSKPSWVKFVKYRSAKGLSGRRIQTSSQASSMRMKVNLRDYQRKCQVSVRKVWLRQEPEIRQCRWPSSNLLLERGDRWFTPDHPQELISELARQSGEMSLVCKWWLHKCWHKLPMPPSRKLHWRSLRIRGQSMNRSLLE